MHALGLKPRRVVVGVGVLLLGLGACSDDGITPDAAAEAGGGSSGGASATSSVNTSATVTATEGQDENADRLDVPPVDPEATAGDTGAFDESGTGGSGDEGGTEGTDVPECVQAQQCHCDPGAVLCDGPEPECPPDHVPLVDERTQCWDEQGACVPIESCLTVLDCSWCDDDEACVTALDLGGLHTTCQPIDPACPDGIPTCECMPMACEEPFFVCVPPPPGATEDLQCECPTC